MFFLINCIFKVEKILKGSLDLIPLPSPSVKIQIMAGKVCLRGKGKTLSPISHKIFLSQLNIQVQKWYFVLIFLPNIAGCCQQTFCPTMFVDNAQQSFAFTTQGNFPSHNLNFHWRWRWWNWIQAIFLNIFLL